MAGLPEEAEKLGCPEKVAQLFCYGHLGEKGDHMQVYWGINPYESHRFGFGYIDTIQRQRAVSHSRHRIQTANDRDTSIQAYEQVMRIREAVQAIKPMMLEPQAIQVASPANATSTASLDLSSGGTATPTTLQSIEEVNASLTSYSTDAPEWTGASTAQAAISGEYDGSDGTDTLRFEVSRGGTRGADNIQIKVYDSSNSLIGVIGAKKGDPVDTQYTLSNGLTVTFSEGDIVNNDTFTLEVYDNVENTVDPDKPFNGTGSDDPNLQYGLDVTGGSFQINGTTIDVLADDTINNVLDKINQADAGVTATFDAATEKVLLTQNTPGSTPGIVLENDTSGFLAAVKLEGAVAIPGEDGGTTEDPATPLAEMESFSAVQSGSIGVNGVSIDIDVNADSLNDVLDRITASQAGVTASYDSDTKKVSLVANDAESLLILDSGSTNFFSTVEIADGTYGPADGFIESQAVNVADVADLVVESIAEENTEKPWAQEPVVNAAPVSAANGSMLTTLVNNMAHAMNTLFDDTAFKGAPGEFLEGVRNTIRETVSASFDSTGPQFNTDFGINFDFENSDEGVFKFSRLNQRQFETALTNPEGNASIRKTLFGTDSNGLFNRLHASLTSAASDLENEIGATGLLLDISI